MEKLTPFQFAKSIKEKYPEYTDVDDVLLANRMLEKYPVYTDRVDINAGTSPLEPVQPKEKAAWFDLTAANIEKERKQDSYIKPGEKLGNLSVNLEPLPQVGITTESVFGTKKPEYGEKRGSENYAQVANKIISGNMEASAGTSISSLKKQVIEAYDELSKKDRVQTPVKSSSIKPFQYLDATDEVAERNLMSARKTLEDAEKILNSPIDKKTGTWFDIAGDRIASWGKGAGERLTNEDFWTMGMSNINRNISALNIAKKLEKGEQLRRDEELLLDSFANLQFANMVRADNMSSAYRGGQGTVDMASFIAQLATTGGLGRLATKGAEKALLKVIAKKVSGKFAQHLANTGTKILTRTGAAAIGATIAPAAFEKTTENLFGKASGEFNGIDLKYTGRQDAMTGFDSYIDGWADTAVEFATEMSGGSLGVIGKVIKEVPGIDKVLKGLARTKLGSAGRILGNNPILKQAGVHGFLGEYNEEFDGAVVRHLLGLEDFKESFWNWDAQATLLYTLGPVAGFSAGMNTVQGAKIKHDFKNSSKLFDDLLLKNGYSQQEIEDLKIAMLDASPEMLGQQLRSIVGSMDDGIVEVDGKPTFNEEIYGTALQFAIDASIYNAYTHGFDEKLEEYRTQAKAFIEQNQNPDMGAIVYAEVAGKPVRVTKGNIVFNGDKLDRENSSKEFYYENENGEIIPANIELVSKLLEVTPIEQATEVAAQRMTAPLIAKEQNEEVRPYEVGEQVTIDVEGSRVMGQIVEKTENGYKFTDSTGMTIDIEPRQIIDEDNLQGVDNGVLVEYMLNGKPQTGLVEDFYQYRQQGQAIVDGNLVNLSDIIGIAQPETDSNMSEITPENEGTPASEDNTTTNALEGVGKKKKTAATETGTKVVGEEIVESEISVSEGVELKNEGKAGAPTKENVTERLKINNPFYKKVEDALVKLGLIEKYNPETGTGDIIGGFPQPTSDGGISAGEMMFNKDGSISYIDGDVKVSFDKNGNVISENTKEVASKNKEIEIEGKKEFIANLKKTRDSENFKYKEVTETDPLGNKIKVRRLKTAQELKESTDKINAAIDKAESELAALEQQPTSTQSEVEPTAAGETPVAELQAEQEKQTFIESLPVNNKGEIDQKKMTVAQTIQYFEYEYGVDETLKAAEQQVKNIEKQLKTAETALSKDPFNIAKKKRASQIQAELQEYKDYVFDKKKAKLRQVGPSTSSTIEEKQNQEKRRAEAEAQRQAYLAEIEALHGVPDVTVDKAKDARARGYRIVNGERVNRQEATTPTRFTETQRKFSDKVSVPVKRTIVEVETLQPSHKNGVKNDKFFITEAQPKPRTDDVSQYAAESIASNINPQEITGGVTAYTGAPIVNNHGEVIQGNNRVTGLQLMYERRKEQAEKYKQYLIENAADYGMTAEQVEAMTKPGAVDIAEVSDEEAIRLGQLNATDTESGGVQRIPAQQSAVSLGEDIGRLSSILYESGEDDLSMHEALDNNGKKALEYLYKKGIINNTQFQSAFNSRNDLTPEAKKDLRDITAFALFEGANDNMQQMFRALPDKAQKAILQTIHRNAANPEGSSIMNDIRGAIEAYYLLKQDESFNTNTEYEALIRLATQLKGQTQLFNTETNLPLQKYSNFAIELAVLFKSDKQKTLKSRFNNLYDALQGVGGDMFHPAETLNLVEAIKKHFNNIDYVPNGQVQRNNVAKHNTESKAGQPSGDGSPATSEQSEKGEQPSQRGRGNEGNNKEEVTLLKGQDLDKINQELSPIDNLNAILSGEKVVPVQSNDKVEETAEKRGESGITNKINSQDPELNPTEAQKEAGNYKKAHINIQGFDITIENPKGSTRSGVDENGREWSNTLQNHYGYFKRTEGKDGDQIDVFIGENPESETVFVVDQNNPESGAFDESKVMLGFDSSQEAQDAYMSNFEEGWQGFGNITPVSVEDFKKWLYDGKKQRKAFAKYKGHEAMQPEDTLTPNLDTQSPEQAIKEFKYELMLRPFGIGTYPKDGFVRFEQTPGSRFGHVVMNRELPFSEWSKWDLNPTTSTENLKGKEFVDKDGDYSKITIDIKGGGADIVFFGENGQPMNERGEIWLPLKDIFENIESGYWVESSPKQTTIQNDSKQKLSETESKQPVKENVKDLEKEKSVQKDKPTNKLREQISKLEAEKSGQSLAEESEAVKELREEIKDLKSQKAKLIKEMAERNGLFGDTKSDPNDLFGGGEVDSNAFISRLDEINNRIKTVNDKIKKQIKAEATGKTEAKQQSINLEEESSPKRETSEQKKSEKLSEDKSDKAVSQEDKKSEKDKSFPKEKSKENKSEQKVEKIEDFGEKIEGARKHLATLNTSTKEDIASMPLSKSFPKPDFKQLVESGQMTIDAAIVMNYLYENIPSKPRKHYRVAGWANKVQGVIDAYNTLLENSEDAAKIVEKLEKHINEFKLYSATLKALGFPANNVSMGGYAIKQFYGHEGYSIVNGSFILGTYAELEDAAKALSEIINKKKTKTTGTKLNIYQDRKTNKFFIGKKGAVGVVRLIDGIETIEEARKVYKEQQPQLQQMWNDLKIDVNERRSTNSPRVGTDYRKGKDVTPEDFNIFGFRGVQFGNYVNASERQQSLNQAYDSLYDLANVLGISPKAISLNGELGLAFGARGSGGKNAASAHYEPGQIVINLTKKKGAGSLAHEWWHALDNYFERARGRKINYLTDSPSTRFNADGSKDLRVREEVSQAFKEVVATIKQSGMGKRSEVLDQARSKAYWSTIIEMSARSFENYIIEKLGETGQRNDYLANFKAMSEWVEDGGLDMSSYPYPTVEETPEINKAFDNLFNTIEETESGELREPELQYGKKLPSTININGVEKPTTNSEGKPIHSTEEGVRNFWEWFGDSEVVDEQGRPLVVYHGTDKKFDTFDKSKKGITRVLLSEIETQRHAFFFTPSEKIAKEIGFNLIPAYLKSESIVDMDDQSIDNKLIENGVEKKYLSPEFGQTWELFDDEFGENIVPALKKMGYDGITFQETGIENEEASQVYGVFSPNQIKSATSNTGEFSPEDASILNEPNINYQPKYKVSETGFYSTVEKSLSAITQEKGTRDQFKAMLLKNGAKQAEMDWMGWDELPEKLTKADIQNWIDANRIEVEEVEKGISKGDEEIRPTKYSKYQEPGGKNYKELLLTMPKDKGLLWKQNKAGLWAYFVGDKQVSDGVPDNTYKEIARKTINSRDVLESRKANFKSDHFNEPNILAHVRFNEREVNGERVLFIEEIQSDWAQSGREKGFKGDTTYDAVLEKEFDNIWDVGGIKVLYFERGVDGKNYRTINKNREHVWFKTLDDAVKQANNTVSNLSEKEISKVPDMPFRKTDQWLNLAARRMMRYAAENGFDRIAWTTGEQQVERFDLSKQVDEIRYEKVGENYAVGAIGKNGEVVYRSMNATSSELEDVIGKEITQKIVNNEGEDGKVKGTKVLSGENLKIGGSGMKAFYDRIVPSAMSKLGKPFGAKVENVSIKQKDNGFTLTLKDNNGNVTTNQFDSKAKAYSWLTNAVNNGSKYEVISEEDGATLSLQQSIPVTESMRKTAMEGMPLFEPQQQFINFTPEEIQDETNKAHGSEEKRQEAINKTVESALQTQISGDRREGFDTGRGTTPLRQVRTVLEGFKESGYVDFVGTEVSSHQDIADLWSIHRSPYIEKTHVIFIKDGKIAGSMAATSGRINQSKVNTPKEIAEHAKKIGATQVYLLHNHPSGHPNVSTQDVKVTFYTADQLRAEGIDLLGHVVVDHDKYSFIDATGEWPADLKTYTLQEWADKTPQFEYKNKVPKLFSERERVEGTSRMFEIGKSILSQPSYKGAIAYLINHEKGQSLSLAAYDILPEGATKEDAIRIAQKGLDNNLGEKVVFLHDGSLSGTWGNTPKGTVDVINIAEKDSDYFFNQSSVNESELEQLWVREGDVEYNPQRELLDAKLNKAQIKFANITVSPSLLREAYQDRHLPVRRFIEQLRETGLNVENFNDWYKQATHLPGKIDAQLEAFERQFLTPMLAEIDKLIKQGHSYRDVENYAILKHGLERNEYMKNKEEEALDLLDEKDYSGITAVQEEVEMSAEDYIKQFEEKSNTDSFWNAVKQATKYSLDKAYEGQIINKEQYNELTNRYKYYIPLRGFDKETAEDRWDYTPDMGTYYVMPLIKAKGRTSRSETPFAFIWQMAQTSINSANKNLHNLSIKRLAELDNKRYASTGLMSISRAWYERTGEHTWELRSPEYSQDKDTYQKNIEEFENRMKLLEEQGFATQKKGKLNVGLFIKPKQAAQHEVHVMQNGEEFVIYFNGNPRVARAINGANAIHNQPNQVQQAVRQATRMMAANFTTRNPLFVLSNFLRDYNYASSTLIVKEGVKYEALFQKNIPLTMGALQRAIRGKSDMTNKMDVYAYEYLMNGGRTGYSSIMELGRVQKRVERKIKRHGKENMFNVALEGIKSANEFAENITRLSVYVTSREVGKDIIQSISDAKEVTVNFNRGGSGRLGGNFFKNYYLFFNANIQALANHFKIWKGNPGRMAALTGAYALSGFIAPFLTALIGGDDGEEEYMKLSDWERQTNFSIYTGNGFIKIPIAHELRVYHTMGDLAYQWMMGYITSGDAAKKMTLSVSDLIPANPMGATEASWAELSPDLPKPFVQLITNTSFMGTRIYDKYKVEQDIPGFRMVRTNKKGEAFAPEFLIRLAEDTHYITGGDGTKGGLDFNPDKLNHIMRGYFGGLYTMSAQAANISSKGIRAIETGEFKLKVRETPLKTFYASSDDLMERNSKLNAGYYDIKKESDQVRKWGKDYIKRAEKGEISIDELYKKLNEINYYYYEGGSAVGINDFLKDINKMENMLKEVSPEEQKYLEMEINRYKKDLINFYQKATKSNKR